MRASSRRVGSYRFSFMRAVSTTNETSSIVIEVSAILVATTTFVRPAGGVAKTFI